MNRNAFPRLSAPRFWLAIVAMIAILGLSACGGGSSSSDQNQTNANDIGEVIVGLTDAEGDFHSYTVDVLSVKLIRQNGAEVETLPLATRVDFAQYTELTEFLTAATVPSGVYTGVSLVVDYSNADIIVEDDLGNGVEAQAVDSNGAPLGQMELQVTFENTDILRIAPGIPAHITLDFDLAASNSVNLSVMPAEVTVEPILVADTILENPKPHRLRGLLNEVAVDADAFSLFIRPFFHHHGEFGSLRVYSNDATTYEIDMVEYTGHEGIVALDALDARTPVVALGMLDRDNGHFTATDVLAGSSVPWGDKDIVTGNVIARSGDQLTLSHVVRHRIDNQVRHQQLITVLVGPDTLVTQQGAGAGNIGIDSDAISVGQHVRVIGEFSDDLTLDATTGRVRMQFTHLSGTAVSVMPLVVDLQAIDLRRPGLFDFSGTGISPADDADPENYEIATGNLSLGTLELAEPVRVIGHVRPFASAPEDFAAQTVVALGNLPASVLINWVDGHAPFVNQSDSSIVISRDPNNFAQLHSLVQGGIATDILDLNQDPQLAPTDNGTGVFIIAFNGRTRLFMRFDRFSEALATLLDGANELVALHAYGTYNADEVSLTSRKIVARVR